MGGLKEGDCRVCAVAGNLRTRFSGSWEGFSHESEHDLALMVSDFLENGSSGADSLCSSDSDSGFVDLPQLAEKIHFHKHNVEQAESDLISTVHMLLLSINETDLQFFKFGGCNSSCIRLSLVKLLRMSGYDAAVCVSKWQGSGKVPGGDHEYVDVVSGGNHTLPDRMIIDIDFRSHFEIARATKTYDTILNSLPVVYVGSLARLKHFLQVMAEAARFSLKQNSMPLPPWRSLAYLQAKWHSSYERKLDFMERNNHDLCQDHKQCIGQFRRLKVALQCEIEAERLLKPIMNDNGRRVKVERRRQPFFRA
ncbi:hypothetical protein AMTRI_Chr08g162490 [Amborella trichopoda]